MSQPQNYYQDRRDLLAAQLHHNSVLCVFSASIVSRGSDAVFPFYQNSDFYYLTGFNEPNAVLVLCKSSSGEIKSILFNQKKDPHAECWSGERLGQQQACKTLAIDEAYSIDALTTKLPKKIKMSQYIYYALGENEKADKIILSLMKQLQAEAMKARKGSAMPTLIDNRTILHEMRLIKNADEIVLLRQSANIAAHAHNKAMQCCQPGDYEYQLEAQILYDFAWAGARTPAYETIVGSGRNGCILHYNENTALLQDGDLVLVDAGCIYKGYCSDISRTFPVNGKFSAPQREIYQLVLTAQKYALSYCRPGVTIFQLHKEVVNIFVEGLLQLGLLTGTPAQIIKDETYKKFFMHLLGHWIGLDVHDVGAQHLNGEIRPLQPGMVLTIEPGLYIPDEAEITPHYRGIGVRIEDMVLITPTGCEILTASAYKEIDEIEQLMQKSNMN